MTIDPTGLKSAYHAAMAKRGLPRLIEQKEQVDKELQATVEKESQLKANISHLIAKKSE